MQRRKGFLLLVAVSMLFLFINGCIFQEPQKDTKPAVKVTVLPPDTTGLANIPDLPLAKIPALLSVKEVVEHRTALHGKTITVRGFVVEAILGEKACPSFTGNNLQTPGPESCAQPRIIVADSLEKTRDLKYDVMILVNEDEEGYSDGQPVEVKGLVFASKVAVYLEKIE